MDSALASAEEVLGTTAPNPSVGAVLVRDGVVLGRGATQPAGGLHAERMALADCRRRGHDPAGATLYTTLEPCNHHGRTPPCTDAIVESGISRVVVGVLDPNPVMRGRSVTLLRDQGIDVEVGELEERCARSILGFARSITRGLPEVTLKVATSADGAIATEEGRSQWITGPEARRQGQVLRARHDAILVGSGTVLADDPRLTCRLEGCTSPVPVVLDGRGRFPAGCNLDRPETRVYSSTDIPGLRAQVFVVPRAEVGVDLHTVLRSLAEAGLHRVLVEGGAQVARSLLDAGLVDTIEQFVAGKLIPGGRGFVGGAPVEDLDRFALELLHHRRVGEDLHLTWALDHTEKPDWAQESTCSPG